MFSASQPMGSVWFRSGMIRPHSLLSTLIDQTRNRYEIMVRVLYKDRLVCTVLRRGCLWTWLEFTADELVFTLAVLLSLSSFIQSLPVRTLQRAKHRRSTTHSLRSSSSHTTTRRVRLLLFLIVFDHRSTCIHRVINHIILFCDYNKRGAVTSLNWAQNHAAMLEVYLPWTNSQPKCGYLKILTPRCFSSVYIIIVCKHMWIHDVTLLQHGIPTCRR